MPLDTPQPTPSRTQIGILGGGPSALYLFKHILESGRIDVAVHIFESRSELGAGMPYSSAGAGVEHITNVSCDEIPELVTPIMHWLASLDPEVLSTFGIDAGHFSEHRVLPRLVFGQYLADQFALLIARAAELGVETTVHLDTRIVDIIDDDDSAAISVIAQDGSSRLFDRVVVCTGHSWPAIHEGTIRDFYESPYPPAKLERRYNHPVAIRGSSLTAVDAIRTLARSSGRFSRDDEGKLCYRADASSPAFRIVMHSRHGLLPCVRFHTETPALNHQLLIPESEVDEHIAQNEGFLSLDFVFDRTFKEPLRERDPEFFARIAHMRLEEFVDAMLSLRERVEPFAFFKGEVEEARKSIRRKESVHWKELLSALSFAMNYPAKHMSAEDMYRHRHVLMPLISIVIAFLPQSSCEELIALHDSGHLDLLSVGAESDVEPRPDGGAIISFIDESGNEVSASYESFVDCVGQRHLSIGEFPFRSLVDGGRVAPARLKFRSSDRAQEMLRRGNDDIEHDGNGVYYSRVSGVAIDDDFRVIGQDGVPNRRVFMMAVPYIGGHNPDYSGLDFAEEAGGRIAAALLEDE